MTPEIREQVEKKAYGIHEWNIENNQPDDPVANWLEAESEIVIDRRTNNGCPLCHFSLLARQDNKIICLRCEYEVEIKRKYDYEEIPSVSEIKREFNG